VSQKRSPEWGAWNRAGEEETWRRRPPSLQLDVGTAPGLFFKEWEFELVEWLKRPCLCWEDTEVWTQLVLSPRKSIFLIESSGDQNRSESSLGGNGASMQFNRRWAERKHKFVADT
jgi:hypothetical protein